MARRGALIIFEGCDRSGKSTQCSKAINWFKENSLPVGFFRFPDRTTVIGRLISSYLENKSDLDDRAIHLLFSANRWELKSEMEKLLTSGTNLIVDRYAFSGVAFSASKPAMNLHWCKQPDVGLIKPDLVVFLDIDPNVAKTRGEYGSERYENLEMQRRVRENYFQLKDETWKVIDANRSIEDVHVEISRLLQEAIDKTSNEIPLQKLWS